MKFLRNLLAVLTGLIIFFGLLFVLFFATLASLSDGLGGRAASGDAVKENSILKINLNLPIKEVSEDDPFAEFMPSFAPSSSAMGLKELKTAIENAKENDKIKGIYLEPGAGARFAVLEEVRNALIDFKTSGKFIYSYSETYSEGAYYVASVSDKIYLNPAGSFELNGMSSNITFVKGTLEKLGVKPYIFRVGQFKSAVEPLMRTNMSDENRKQYNELINSIYDHYLKKVSESRKIPIDRLEMISDSMLVRNPKDALELRIVTHLSYYDEVLADLKEAAGISKNDDDEENDINFVSYKKLSNAKNMKSENRIAVIVAEGSIVSGEGGKDQIGSDKIAKEIRKARKDDKIKAIVLRINSPGGSGLASDVMWREVMLAKKEKPIIASMSGVAASGGYYMAMACDTIVAQPNTITGSIGVFGVLMNLQELKEKHLGMTSDGVKTGEFSDLGNTDRPMTEYEQSMIQAMVDEFYEDFTAKVAQGRGMDQDSVKKIAGGRVWTGIQALENGLVDVLGGLDDAIKLAASAAGIGEDYKLRYYPVKEKTFLEELMGNLNTEMQIETALQSELGDLYPYVQQIREAKTMDRIQARMPYDLIIE